MHYTGSINHHIKNICEVDELFVFLSEETNMPKKIIEELFQEYAEYVEEKTRFKDLKKALNQNPGMKREVKYKMMEAHL